MMMMVTMMMMIDDDDDDDHHHHHQVGAVEKVDLTKWADHRHKMLFVLDGLDECSQVYIFRCFN